MPVIIPARELVKTKNPLIYEPDEFGLSLGKLASLGGAKVKLHASLRHIDEKSLFKFKPSQRIEKMKRHYELLFSRVKKNWSDGPLKVSWTRRQPRGFSAVVEANRLSRVSRMPEIGSICLVEVPGRKRRREKPTARWFAVKARFAIQIEGQRTGLQTYEDRIVIVKAMSSKEAESKLLPKFKTYGSPYLNSDGFMVRWEYERILDNYLMIDVYGGPDEKTDPRGVEVFSELARRRMKPEFAWKPKPKEKAHAT